MPVAGLFAMGLAVVPAAAEPPPPASTAPSPAETSPLPTTTMPDTSKAGPGTPAPTPEQAPIPRPAQSGAAPMTAPAASPAPAGRQTLVQTPGEPNDVDEVVLPAKPAAILSGTTKWEEAVPSLKASFRRIEDQLAKAGVTPTGRPIAVFTKTEDDGFQYDAMIPVQAVPAQAPSEGDVRYGTTPSGKALRFPHKGSYDEIDGTYETLTAYLDAKEIAVQDRFVEEYVTDLTERADEKLDVNIYALPK